jgi:hypothetical protein
MNKKMKKRVIKLFKETEWGSHDSMMEAIELFIDTKNSDPFDDGYQSCMQDMAVRSFNLASYIHEESDKRGNLAKDKNGDTISFLTVEETGRIIEEYFNHELNG